MFAIDEMIDVSVLRLFEHVEREENSIIAKDIEYRKSFSGLTTKKLVDVEEVRK